MGERKRIREWEREKERETERERERDIKREREIKKGRGRKSLLRENSSEGVSWRKGK